VSELQSLLPEGTRGRVLRAALELFAEYGFYGASIRDIAANAGIKSATLYAHYPSKEHILAELVRLGHELLYDRLRQAVVRSGSSPADQLRDLVRSDVLAHCDFPQLAIVANNDLHALSPEQAASAIALRRQAHQLVMDVIDHGVKTGDFKVPDTFLVATALGSMGMRVAYWYHPELKTAEQVADSYADLALRMVGYVVP